MEDVTASLRKALTRENVDGVKFSSHTLKGLAGLYGLAELSEQAALTHSHCFPDMHAKMVEHGMRATELAETALLNIDGLFDQNEEAA